MYPVKHNTNFNKLHLKDFMLYLDNLKDNTVHVKISPISVA